MSKNNDSLNWTRLIAWGMGITGVLLTIFLHRTTPPPADIDISIDTKMFNRSQELVGDVLITKEWVSDFGAMMITSANKFGALNDGYLINNSINLDHPDFVEMHILGDYVGNAPKDFKLGDWSGYIRQATADMARKLHEVKKGSGDIIAPLALKQVVGQEVARLLDSFDDGQVPEQIRPELIGLQKAMQSIAEYWEQEKAKGKAEEE